MAKSFNPEMSMDPEPTPWRVAIPAHVAFDLERFQGVVAQLARELGCEGCLSGAHCAFLLIKDYVVNPEGKLDPEPDPWAGSMVEQFGG